MANRKELLTYIMIHIELVSVYMKANRVEVSIYCISQFQFKNQSLSHSAFLNSKSFSIEYLSLVQVAILVCRQFEAPKQDVALK